MTNTIKIIFTISVLVNVLLVGFVAGSAYRQQTQWKDVKTELSDKGHDIVQKNLVKSREDMREKFKEMKKHHTALKKIVEAPEFDQEAYDQTIEHILRNKDEMARFKAEAMGKTLAELPPEERKKLSGRMLKSLSGKGGGRKNRDSDRDFRHRSDRIRDRP